MRLQYVWALALNLGLNAAFKDTSPFFLFSTSEYRISHLECQLLANLCRLLTSSPNLVSASSLQKTIDSQLKTCPSNVYIIVSQPGVNAVDFHDYRATPNLAQWLQGEDKEIRSSFVAQDVKGVVDAAGIRKMLQVKCDAEHVRQDVSSMLAAEPQTIFSMGKS